MTYAFRKYLDKRGSALFMVLSLMTALMILVMAMYFSVVSSRDVQYKVFYQEQAYRSATSLSDAIVAGLKGNSWQTDTGSPLLTAITGLKGEGDYITTNGNDFKAFVTTGTKEEQDQLGAYTVTITRMADETINKEKTRVFDIAITTSSGGVLDTMHTFIHITEPQSESTQGKTNIFTSTGYVPNDVFLDGVMTYTDLFYDNAYVFVTGQSRFYSNLYAGGSLTINETGGITPNEPLTWGVRNNFTNKATINFSNSGRGMLLIGGDATFNGGNVGNADIYVLGDVYYNGGNFNNCRMFVYGSIVKGSPNVGSNLYSGATAWNAAAAAHDDIMSSSEMAKLLDELTASNDYSKWEINDDAPAKKYYVKELDPKSSDYKPLTIAFDPTHRTQVLQWKDGYQIADYFGSGQPLNYTPYVINDITASWGDLGDRYCGTLIIDTGDDPQNQVLIRVNPNRDFDGDLINETFEWAPDGSYTTMSVLVRGCGSVVIDLPAGVTYQASDNTVFMHETWYATLGGAIENYTKCADPACDICKKVGVSGTLYTQGNNAAFGYGVNDALPYIHRGCDQDCDKCDYKVKTTGTASCSECGKAVTEITCEAHKLTYEFCPDCKPGLEPAKDGNKYYGLCTSRVERSAVETKVNSLSADWKALLKANGDGTNWYYPNTNNFIVSCDESADIRLATDKFGVEFSKASFWGFVYAPYMTYKGMGNGAGWPVFCGGMIVADYVIKGYNVYLSCYPDMLPENLMNEANRKDRLDALASKSWKISLAGY